MQANFAYDTSSSDAAGLPLAVSIYADRAHLRGTMRDDAESAGFRVTVASGLAELLEGEARPLGEVVLVDCPAVDGATLAALSRLDIRAARCGASLIVSTAVDALDDVFSCLDQSGPQILVDPTRAERVVALGHLLSRLPQGQVRELGEEDRLMILRLTEQVGRIAGRLDSFEGTSTDRGPEPEGGALFRFGTGDGGKDSPERQLMKAARPSLPDPRLVRRMIRQRQLRARFFDGDLFADPAWDMLLDLTAARAEHARVSVTSLCIASGVPPTTALRWIGQMTEAGLLRRIEDDTDRRRAFIALTEKAAEAMARYFAEIGTPVPASI